MRIVYLCIFFEVDCYSMKKGPLKKAVSSFTCSVASEIASK